MCSMIKTILRLTEIDNVIWVPLKTKYCYKTMCKKKKKK